MSLRQEARADTKARHTPSAQVFASESLTVHPDQYARLASAAAATSDSENNSVLDPVCGMKIAHATAKATVERAGVAKHFCNQSCATQCRTTPV